ncbi:MAG: hypothetical protein QME71_08530 [Dehalococcoidia bacterium]|nr:hypothetical protein [Dehalococcoidia bacterium]
MTYIIESRHTPQECLRALDDVLERGPEVLDRFEWGCAKGEHTGWALVEAGSESEVRDMIPESVLDRTRIVEVSKFTPEKIKSLHEK